MTDVFKQLGTSHRIRFLLTNSCKMVVPTTESKCLLVERTVGSGERIKMPGRNPDGHRANTFGAGSDGWSAVCVLYAAPTCDRVWFVLVLRYCEPCYGRLPLIQVGTMLKAFLLLVVLFVLAIVLMELAFLPPRE
jgi:hypothetical protein